MNSRHSGFLYTDERGRLVIPAEVAARLHLQPGQAVPYLQDGSGLHLGRPADYLGRVYVEPTSHCNFDCRTCMRNAWDEPLGWMSAETFGRLLAGLQALPVMPTVFFGGYGEPLAHSNIIEMVCQVKQLGARVELITNGTLLDGHMSAALVEAGLDLLWVSLDGATPEAYTDVRLGNALTEVIANLEGLRQARHTASASSPRLGIAFVAMRRNIHELPEVIRLGRRLGAERFSISNVLPHTPELREEMLYRRSFYDTDQPVSQWAPLIQLPRLEFNDLTSQPIAEALQGRASLSLAGQELHQGGGRCPFVHKYSTAIRWDGSVSPCLPLLHSHTSYLEKTVRQVQAFSLDNINASGLVEIWGSPEYQALRERLLSFDFSPCVLCNSCEMAESNREDCFGNTAPTCGGCLWAQGFIQCP